ncbi:hypothetical protein [Acanthopleuribacter pedis]|uniref:Tetratricopeptide repeat protein n=1 Tax=Acanthopleuribacter pedis TaxID=442870 RepID=A0A8J7Q8Z4_9BACT|nr:hypothetical protein [Acanthopleuribacter pedis]MBO1319129.1 hypothetical protein [Acanthopleuribacter pedis]
MTVALSVLSLVCFASPVASHQCSITDYFRVIEGQQPQALIQLDVAPRSEHHLEADLRHLHYNPADVKATVEVGLSYFSVSESRNFDFLARACGFLGEALAKSPGDAELTMHLGLATGARALDMKPTVFKRLKFAREGFRLMDKAVALAPDCPNLRLLRGGAQLMAHPILRRGETLKQDAGAVLAFMKSPSFERLPDYQRARYHLFAGSYSDRGQAGRTEAEAQWRLAADLGGDSAIAQEAQARLLGTFHSMGYTGD